MAETRERATGIIKKVFLKKTEPFGFLKLLTPPELRGEEAVFLMKDMLLQPFEKKLLHYGMAMQFYVKEKSTDYMQTYVPFRAEELKPLDPAEYSAYVIRSADPEQGGREALVCLDISLTRVMISRDSYEALGLETPLSPGDACTVRISWREMCDAALDTKTPTGEIVAVLKQQSSPAKDKSVKIVELPTNDKVSPSSDKSSDSKDQISENELTSDVDLSCEEGHGDRRRRDRNVDFEPRRRRHRSVGDEPFCDSPGMQYPYTGQSHMYPFMPCPGYMHPDDMHLQLWMQSQKYYPQADAAQRFPTMNNHAQQCHPGMSSAQYQHPAMSSARWLPPIPPSYEASRREPRVRMTLREYLDRGGKVLHD